jgi:hypothetical protein
MGRGGETVRNSRSGARGGRHGGPRGIGGLTDMAKAAATARSRRRVRVDASATRIGGEVATGDGGGLVGLSWRPGWASLCTRRSTEEGSGAA